MRYSISIGISIFILSISFPHSSNSHPWIPDFGKYELLFSNKIYFTEIASEISNIEYIAQKEIAKNIVALKREQSRRKKVEIQNSINNLEEFSKNLFDYYPINEQNLYFEYGLLKKTSLGFSYSFSNLKTYSNNELIGRRILTPYIKYNIYNKKKLNITLLLELNNTSFDQKIKRNINLGISTGYSKQKGTKKRIHYYDFAFSPKNFYKFTMGNGIEFSNGYLCLSSISYFKTISLYQNMYSDKIINELFLAKKLYKSNGMSRSVFLNYTTEYSKYSNIKFSHSIQVGIYFK